MENVWPVASCQNRIDCQASDRPEKSRFFHSTGRPSTVELPVATAMVQASASLPPVTAGGAPIATLGDADRGERSKRDESKTTAKTVTRTDGPRDEALLRSPP